VSAGTAQVERATTLLVGTDKGLFVVRRGAGGWRIEGPQLAGSSVLQVVQSPDRPRELHAAVRHNVWGAHLYRSADGGDSWTSLDAVPHHPPGRHATALKAVWGLAWTSDNRLLAGIDPAGLFVSDDRGATWQDLTGLNEHETRRAWEPSRGIFAVHSICAGPAGTGRIVVAVSAGGAYRSDDGGLTFSPANAGVRAENLPERYPVAGHNVHRIVMHAGSGRLYRQCYNGTYVSDDGGRQWTEISAGLPSDFGYAIACDPNDEDTVFQVPESGADLRITVDARLRVYRSRDAGRSWASASDGLPQQHVYVTVLREAMDTDAATPCGVYFGTSTGHLFASLDGGERWELVAAFLPRILSVRALRPAAA
jgi:photosystem II stability/assembly factor-like uncharacterized protein